MSRLALQAVPLLHSPPLVRVHPTPHPVLDVVDDRVGPALDSDGASLADEASWEKASRPAATVAFLIVSEEEDIHRPHVTARGVIPPQLPQGG